MRFVVFVMLLGCVLAASVNRNRRDGPKRKNNSHADIDKTDNLENEVNSRVRRYANADTPNCTFTLWANGLVCYEFEDGLSESMRATLETVFQRYMDVSCVRFVQKSATECDGITALPVEISTDENGCWAHVGCSSSQNTRIQMKESCNSAGNGVVYHEVFHALGRFHEQTRQDRDNFVQVNTANIDDTKETNYDMCNRTLYGLPYDYQSIMHYSDRHFAVNGQPTMTIIESGSEYNQKIMGSQVDLSPLDIVTLNKMYSCYPDGTDYTDCDHGGVRIGDTTSTSCYCVRPFTGDRCEDVDANIARNTTIASGDVVLSLNYPALYPSDDEEFRVIICPSGTRLSATFVTFDIEGYGCGYDHFDIFRKVGDHLGARNCGNSLEGQTLTFEDNYMVFDFTSDDLYNYEGFNMTISCSA